MDMSEIAQALLLKNRTIVSRDFEEAIEFLGAEIPLEIHRYPSGSDHGTWIIPPQWDVIKAELTDGAEVIASYRDHPLFLAPYSCPFCGWVTREELLGHVKTDSASPDAYVYEYRLAADYQRRLKDWVISLPYRMVERLDKPRYFVDIQVNTQDGNMLVAESRIEGRMEQGIAFLSHLCHPGQLNDGLAGVAAGIEVMKRIKEVFPSTTYSYSLLIMPETFGSAVYAASNQEKMNRFMGAVFLEMPGTREKLHLKLSRRGTAYLDRIMRYVMQNHGAPYEVFSFHEGYGNDEKIFDYPGIGVPALSLQRYPLRTYHTSADDLSGNDASNMEEIVDILLRAVGLIERDFIPRFRQNVPVYLTRFSLYNDAVTQRDRYLVNLMAQELAWQGLSAFDIAVKLGVSPQMIMEYLGKFAAHGLLEPEPLTPAYARMGQPEGDGASGAG